MYYKTYYNEIFRNWIISKINVKKLEEIPEIKKIIVAVPNRELDPNIYSALQLSLTTLQKPTCHGGKQKKTKQSIINLAFTTLRKNKCWNFISLLPIYLGPTSLDVENIEKNLKFSSKNSILFSLKESQHVLRILFSEHWWASINLYIDMNLNLDFKTKDIFANKILMRMCQWPIV